MDRGQQATELIANNDLYNEFSGDYDDEFEFFRQVRNRAPKTLDFEEYIELHSIFLRHDTSGRVQMFIEENLARSLRNMVTKGSRQGRTYAVETLAELEARRTAFTALDVTVPDLYTVIETFLETVYDEDWSEHTRRIDRLLKDTGDCSPAVVNVLARAQATIHLKWDYNPETVINAYREVTDPLVSDAPETAEECLDAIQTLPYDRRADLLQTALHRENPSPPALFEFLRWSAFDEIESARHRGTGGYEPSRGSLGLATLQLSVSESRDPQTHSSAHTRRIEAYLHATEGILASGGYWMSTRETPPDPDFEHAAVAFRLASQALEPIHLKRSVTYLSKSYRMVTHTTESPSQHLQIHRECIDEIIDRAAQSDRMDSDRRVNARVTDTLQYHQMEVLKAIISRLYLTHRYDEIAEPFHECQEFADTCTHPAASLSDVLPYADVCYAIREEQAENFEEALIWFEGGRAGVDESRKETPERFDDRILVTKFKQAILARDYETAEVHLDACSKEYGLLRAALNRLRGDFVTGRGREALNKLPGIRPGHTRLLSAYVSGSTDQRSVDEETLIRAIHRI